MGLKMKMREFGAAAVRVFRMAACTGGLAVLTVAGLPLLVVGVMIYPALLWLAGKWTKNKDGEDTQDE